MEVIRVFRVKKKVAWFFIGLGLAAIVFAVIVLINAILSGFRMEFIGGDWIYVLNIAHGLIFIGIGFSMLQKSKYFVRWNDSEVSYLLPGNKGIETIRIDTIEEINPELFMVRLKVNGSEKNLDLHDIDYKKLRLIKDYFEKLKLSAGK